MGYGVKTLPVLRDDKLVDRYFPRINVGGTMCYIKEKNGLFNVAEYEKKEDAQKRAKEEFERMNLPKASESTAPHSEAEADPGKREG